MYTYCIYIPTNRSSLFSVNTAVVHRDQTRGEVIPASYSCDMSRGKPMISLASDLYHSCAPVL